MTHPLQLAVSQDPHNAELRAVYADYLAETDAAGHTAFMAEERLFQSPTDPSLRLELAVAAAGRPRRWTRAVFRPYDLWLIDGERTLATIKQVWLLVGEGLKDAKTRWDARPSLLVQGVDLLEAGFIAQRFDEEAGAVLEWRPSSAMRDLGMDGRLSMELDLRPSDELLREVWGRRDVRWVPSRTPPTGVEGTSGDLLLPETEDRVDQARAVCHLRLCGVEASASKVSRIEPLVRELAVALQGCRLASGPGVDARLMRLVAAAGRLPMVEVSEDVPGEGRLAHACIVTEVAGDISGIVETARLLRVRGWTVEQVHAILQTNPEAATALAKEGLTLHPLRHDDP